LATCLYFYEQGFVSSVFVLTIWKEIYMVLLIEIFWSFADVVFSIRSARWIYGLVLSAGSLAGFVGNFFIGDFAKAVGTASAVWWVLPILMLCWLISILFASSAGDQVPAKGAQKGIHWFESINVVLKSRYLVPLLLLVTIIQIATKIIDYEFSGYIKREFLDLDARTNIIGKTHSIVDFIAVALQLATAFILRLLGVGKTLIAVPFIISGAVAALIALPGLATMMVTKVMSKCFDYSLFRASKEILYIPLSHIEKTQGKALIDILTYRIGGGLASALILLIIALKMNAYMMQITLGFLLIWIVLTYIIVKRYRSIVSLEQEFAGDESCSMANEKNDP
jgi:ATP/ADP translocase